MSVEGILDIENTRLNGIGGNLSFGKYEIPASGGVECGWGRKSKLAGLPAGLPERIPWNKGNHGNGEQGAAKNWAKGTDSAWTTVLCWPVGHTGWQGLKTCLG